ncbi:hypothetical protein [Pantoea sp. BAV 3049]|uniref:hypothetical protein n=1 Tax=Pantoea sp. BAV 3049 TaxID=2654188 RepID=UPI00131D7E82|nr:hypothetical protein [Pantoea sp. BAV 3049]
MTKCAYSSDMRRVRWLRCFRQLDGKEWRLRVELVCLLKEMAETPATLSTLLD